MNNLKQFIKIALVDDHLILRSSLSNLIEGFGDCKVVMDATNGKDLMEKLLTHPKPDLIILDLNMPEMDGYETAQWLKKEHPEIHILMLTMYDSEATLIRLLQAGVKGFLKKDIHPSELKYAINAVMQFGFYYSHNTTGKLMNLFRNDTDAAIQKNILTEHEVVFLKLVASDLTYKEIAEHLGLNPRTVDNLRDHLFEKLDVKSRVGLAIYAIKKGLIGI
jgi:hypothetical protein